jgi:hypothetical protein
MESKTTQTTNFLNTFIGKFISKRIANLVALLTILVNQLTKSFLTPLVATLRHSDINSTDAPIVEPSGSLFDSWFNRLITSKTMRVKAFMPLALIFSLLLGSMAWGQTLSTVTVGSQTGTVTYGTASSVTFAITATRSGKNGNNNTVTLSISALPSGVTASFATNPLDFGSSASAAANTQTTTLTISTTVSANAVQNLSFTVSAIGGAGLTGTVTDNESFTIGKATPTISVSGTQTFTYNGSAQGPSTISYNGDGTTSLLYTNTSGATYSSATAPTNAGSYQVVASATAGTNYNAGSSSAYTFTIGKATPTISVSGTQSFIYNGSAQGPSTNTYNGDGTTSLLYTNTSGTAYSSATAPTNAGSYQVVASATAGTNYNAGSSEAYAFVIGKAATTTVVTINGGPFTYTGSAIEPATVTVTGANLSLTPAAGYADNINAGTATASYAYAESANHLGSSDSETFAIGKADQTITVTTASPASATYNTGFTVAATASSGLTVAYTSTAPLSNTGANYTMNSGTGTGVVKYNQAGDDNYNAAPEVTANVNATKAESTIVATGTTSFTYSGSAQGPDSSTVTGSTGLVTYSYSGTSNGSVAYGPSATKPTLAGSYSVLASVAADDNFNGKSSEAYAFVIGKAATTTVVTINGGPFTYTGSAIEPATVTVTGANLSLTPAAGYADNINAGTATASYAYAESANHLGSSDSETFAIGKAATTTIVTVTQPLTYNGNPQGGTANVTGAGGLDMSLTVMYVGTGSTIYASSVIAPTNAGTYSASAVYAGSANYFGSNDTKALVIGKAITTTIVTVTQPLTYNGNSQGGTANVTGAGGLNIPLTVMYVGTGSTTYASSATAPTNAGTYSASAVYAESDNYLGSSNAKAFTIGKAPVSSTVNVIPTSVQYSDQVTFTATITGGYIGGIKAAESATFIVGTQTMGTANFVVSNSDIVATGTYALVEGVVGQMAPGTKTVTAMINSPDPNFAISSLAPTPNLEITKEDAVVSYIGNEITATQSTTNLSATLDLRVSVQDRADDYRGDIKNATVEFKLDGLTILGPIKISVLVDPFTGVISKSHTVTLSKNTPSETFTLEVLVDGYYTGRSEEVITVYVPTGDFITGGGHIIPTASAGTYASTEGTKTNFGFNVKFNKKGTNLQGKLNFIWRTGGKVYQAKSNATDALGVDIADPSAKLAVFTSKCNINDITDPLNPVSLGGNKIMHITMTDRGEPGVNDDISFTLWDGNSLLYSSQWTGTSSSKMKLKGGNIVVHSGFSTGTTATKTEDAVAVSTQSIAEEVVDETLLFNVSAYPNPSADYFTLKLQGMLNEDMQKVEVNVFDLLGRQVYTKQGNAQDSYEFGQQFQVGVYLVTVKQGNNTASLKVIKK